MPFTTVKACAVDVICREGHRLSNKQIAQKVSALMHSRTTYKSIAWYKNKINRGVIKVDRPSCKWLQKGKPTPKEVELFVPEIEVIENEAEHYVYEYEINHRGKKPRKMPSGSGYDIESDDRHIEVKGKKSRGRTTTIQLTSNETETLIKDPKYYLYLVEGDFDHMKNGIDLYMIPQKDLLAMAQLKIHARLTQIANKENKETWLAKI
jgi:hypothetical protein